MLGVVLTRPYVKAMRTPWVLNTLADMAFVGLGFSIDHSAERGKHVVLVCSHIYSGRAKVCNTACRRLKTRLSRHNAVDARGGRAPNR